MAGSTSTQPLNLKGKRPQPSEQHGDFFVIPCGQDGNCMFTAYWVASQWHLTKQAYSGVSKYAKEHGQALRSKLLQIIQDMDNNESHEYAGWVQDHYGNMSMDEYMAKMLDEEQPFYCGQLEMSLLCKIDNLQAVLLQTSKEYKAFRYVSSVGEESHPKIYLRNIQPEDEAAYHWNPLIPAGEVQEDSELPSSSTSARSNKRKRR